MTQKNEEPHISVMSKEFLQFFEGKEISYFFDGTLGAGGHARALLEAHPEIKTYIGCDRDPEALEIARENLKPWKDKVSFVQGNFADLDRYIAERGDHQMDGFFLIWGYRLCN